jgi:heat shock protein HslJ
MALLALVLVVTSAACGERPDARGGADPGQDPVAGDYVSDSVPGPAFAGDGAPLLRMSLDGGEIRFSADCNTFFGTASWDNGRFSVRDLGGTEMGCSPARHERDAWLLDFFSRADRVERDGTDLAVHAGRTTIWFVPAEEVGEDQSPAVRLEGTSWTLTAMAEYDGDTGSVGSVPAGVTATLRIEGGRVLFETGCNSGSGPVEVDGDTLRFGDLVVTLRGCLDARADVQRSVLRVLDGSVTWSIAGRELRLRRGGHELVYTAAADGSVADAPTQ